MVRYVRSRSVLANMRFYLSLDEEEEGRLTVVTLTSNSSRESPHRFLPKRVTRPAGLIWLALTVLLCAFSALAQSQPPVSSLGTEGGQPNASGTGSKNGVQQSDQPSPGDITGTVLDQTGAVVAGAHVTLVIDGQS